MKSRVILKMGHVGSKPGSLGQILDKPCVHSSGHIFSPDNHETWSGCLSMKSRRSQNMGHVQWKTRSPDQS